MMQIVAQRPRRQRKWYQFMLDIEWPELIVIGSVAVVAIGPKDLPKVMNTMGRFAGKARMMAQDVQRSLEQLNFEAEAAERVKNEPPAAPTHTAAHSHHHTTPHVATPAKAEGEPATTEEPHDHLGST